MSARCDKPIPYTGNCTREPGHDGVCWVVVYEEFNLTDRDLRALPILFGEGANE